MNRALLAAFAAAVAAALVATWPAPVRPDIVIGHWNHPDGLSNHWLLVWVAEHVLQGRDLLHNDQYYWPIGDWPMLAGNGGEGLLYLPFHLAFGWPYGVTAYAVTVLVAQGTAAGWAAGRLGGGPVGAAVAAAAFAANPYVLQELGSGRFTQMDAVWLAIALGAAAVWLQDARHGAPPPPTPVAVAVGAAWGIASALYWYHGYFVALAALPLLAVHVAARRGLPARSIAIATGTGLVVLAGPLAWFLSHWSLIPGTDEDLDFPHREAWGDGLPLLLPLDVHGAHQGFAMSAVALVLAAVALAVDARRRDAWTSASLLALGLFAWSLAAGPRFLGEWPGPYELFYGGAAVLRRFWWPSRHLVLVQWAVAVLAGRGAAHLLAPLGRRARTVGAIALVAATPAALALQDDLWQVPLSRWERPAFYERLAELPDGVVAELPISPRLAGTQQTLIYQLVHHKRLLGGHAAWVNRVRPAAWDRRLADNSFFAGLVAWEEGRTDRVTFNGADLVALRDEGLRWITSNPEYPPRGMTDAAAAVMRPLFGEPVIAIGAARCWDITRWTGTTDSGPVPFRPGPGTTWANGNMPMVTRHAESLGFHLVRDPNKPFQGLHPSGPSAPRRP